MTTNFDDIRPYRDEEIPAAMQRIANHELIPSIANYLMPGADVEVLRERIGKVSTVAEFQYGLVKEIIEVILKKTTTSFECTGVENIAEKKPYLFVSNHRDIVLDAMFLQYALHAHGHGTCQITFGSNLMCHPLVIDFGKSNKMFRTERGGNKMEFYNSLLHMSEYMRHAITEQKESVWIAQRNGRTKDGIDVTDPAIIKMFGMSDNANRVESLAELNIVPVSVSYEWESCDKLKTLELYISRSQKYEKRPGEDLNSILTGIKQQKGRVCFHFCEPVSADDLDKLNSFPGSAYYRQIAALMDQRINSNFKLQPNNYIAHDLRSESDRFSSLYTAEEKKRFIDYMTWMDEYKDMDQSVLKEIFLGIYANPVDSFLKTIC